MSALAGLAGYFLKFQVASRKLRRIIGSSGNCVIGQSGEAGTGLQFTVCPPRRANWRWAAVRRLRYWRLSLCCPLPAAATREMPALETHGADQAENFPLEDFSLAGTDS